MYAALGLLGSEGEAGDKYLRKFKVSVFKNATCPYSKTIDNALVGNNHLLSLSNRNDLCTQ